MQTQTQKNIHVKIQHSLDSHHSFSLEWKWLVYKRAVLRELSCVASYLLSSCPGKSGQGTNCYVDLCIPVMGEQDLLE